MKEIIYLDTDIMNSLLAQLDHGIVDSYTNINVKIRMPTYDCLSMSTFDFSSVRK